jgi:hypothetical protein
LPPPSLSLLVPRNRREIPTARHTRGTVFVDPRVFVHLYSRPFLICSFSVRLMRAAKVVTQAIEEVVRIANDCKHHSHGDEHDETVRISSSYFRFLNSLSLSLCVGCSYD